MHAIEIINTGGAWPELKTKMGSESLIDITGGNSIPWQVARIPNGTKEGNSSVIFRFDLPDGRVIVAETTMKLLFALAAGMRGAEERDGIVNQ